MILSNHYYADELFRYFQKILYIFSTLPFYMTYVYLPMADDPPLHRLCKNPKFWPYFKDTIGALDRSHTHSAPPASDMFAQGEVSEFELTVLCNEVSSLFVVHICVHTGAKLCNIVQGMWQNRANLLQSVKYYAV